MADIAGWEMPLAYRGVLEEVAQVRSHAGVFDMSHLARFRIRGDGGLAMLERLCTHDVAHQEDDTAVATLMLNDQGGIVTDGVLVRLEDQWLLVCPPINRAKVLEYLQGWADQHDAKLDDQTGKSAVISLAGPAAAAVLDKVLPERVSTLGANSARGGSLMLAKYVVMRTNWTGLWGIDVIMPNLFAGKAWRFITEKAGEGAIAPAGLAALDVLRMEAGLAAYGHELNETIDPVAAGLMDRVSFDHDFIGAQSLAVANQRTPDRIRCGLVLEKIGTLPEKIGTLPIFRPAGQDSSVLGAFGAASDSTVTGSDAENGKCPYFLPRQGSGVYRADGSECGTVTSSAFSPALDKAIAQAYLAADVIAPGTTVLVETQGGRQAAKPFRISEFGFRNGQGQQG